MMHSVSVYATTVMEAAALGRKELLDTGLIDDPAYEITIGPGTPFPFPGLRRGCTTARLQPKPR